MHKWVIALAIGLLSISTATPSAQQCLHGPGETPDQTARRREALTATRTINNIQANQPASANRSYFRHADLAEAPYAAKMRESTNETLRRISLNPNGDILPGWTLTLDVSENGYWFMIKDTSDPCGFAFISNQSGLIFNALPLQ
jgi:hypothetical protein